MMSWTRYFSPFSQSHSVVSKMFHEVVLDEQCYQSPEKLKIKIPSKLGADLILGFGLDGI